MNFKVRKITLILFASIVWLIIGVSLLVRSANWISLMLLNEFIIASAAGLILAVIKSKYAFYKVVRQNITRIMNKPDVLHHFFEFHSLKFYLLLPPMIILGIILRTSESIPKSFVFPVYIGIGIGMIYSSILYFYKYIKIRKGI